MPKRNAGKRKWSDIVGSNQDIDNIAWTFQKFIWPTGQRAFSLFEGEMFNRSIGNFQEFWRNGRF